MERSRIIVKFTMIFTASICIGLLTWTYISFIPKTCFECQVKYLGNNLVEAEVDSRTFPTTKECSDWIEDHARSLTLKNFNVIDTKTNEAYCIN